MAAGGSAVFPTEERWKGFTETAERLQKELTENLQSVTRETEKVVNICEEYHNQLGNDSVKVKQLHVGLKDRRADLESLQAKVASKEISIEFVGRTSSGKSSLINALLRSHRLPVSKWQTTMCLITVRTTSDKKWSVDKIDKSGKKTRLSNEKSKEAVKKLLNKLSSTKHIDERKKLQIDCHSTIQVNWPRHLCKLPENVVFIDTPGLKEDEVCDQVVIDSCKKADIVVAVMDVMSPSIKEIAEVLNEVKSQFNFGVFTKWDVEEEEEEEEEDDDDDDEGEEEEEEEVEEDGTGEIKKHGIVQKKQARQDDERDFRMSVELPSEIYFVDAKHIPKKKLTEGTGDATKGFLKFEKSLEECAKSLKGVLLIQEAKTVVLKSEKVFQNFQRVIEERRTKNKEALDSLQSEIDLINKDHASLEQLRQGVKSSEQLMDDILNDEAIVNLVEEFDNIIQKSKSEDEIIKKFLATMNRQIKVSVDSEGKEVIKKYKLWKDNVKSVRLSFLSESLPSYEVPQLLRQELPKDFYNKFKDIHSYLTSSELWGGLCGAAAAGAAAVTLREMGRSPLFSLVAAAGVWEAATATATAADKHANLGIAGAMRAWVLVSPKKRDAWKQFLSGELKKLRKHKSKKSPLEEIRQISANISAEIKKMTDSSSTYMNKLSGEISNLESLVEDIWQSRSRLQVVRKQLDELEREARSVNTVSPDDQTENQSAADRCGTFV